jgi:hypothetical protein
METLIHNSGEGGGDTFTQIIAMTTAGRRMM